MELDMKFLWQGLLSVQEFVIFDRQDFYFYRERLQTNLNQPLLVMQDQFRDLSQMTSFQAAVLSLIQIFTAFSVNVTRSRFNESQITQKIIQVLVQNIHPQVPASLDEVQRLPIPAFNLSMDFEQNFELLNQMVCSLDKIEHHKERIDFFSAFDLYESQIYKRPEKKLDLQYLEPSSQSALNGNNIPQQLKLPGQIEERLPPQKINVCPLKMQTPSEIAASTKTPQTALKQEQAKGLVSAEGKVEQEQIFMEDEFQNIDFTQKQGKTGEKKDSATKQGGRTQKSKKIAKKTKLKKPADDEVKIEEKQLSQLMYMDKDSSFIGLDCQNLTQLDKKIIREHEKKLNNKKAQKNRLRYQLRKMKRGTVPKPKKKPVGKKPGYPEMQKELNDWIPIMFKKTTFPLTQFMIRKKAMELVKFDPGFQASKGWAQKFLNRHPETFKLIKQENKKIIQNKLQQELLQKSLKQQRKTSSKINPLENKVRQRKSEK